MVSLESLLEEYKREWALEFQAFKSESAAWSTFSPVGIAMRPFASATKDETDALDSGG